MRQALKKVCALFLCAVMLCSYCVFPVAAVKGEGICAIHSVTMENGTNTAYVQVTSKGGSVLFVALYNSNSGQILGIGSSDISESVTRKEVPVTVSYTKDDSTTVKALLVDNESKPLCANYTLGNTDIIDITIQTVGETVTTARQSVVGSYIINSDVPIDRIEWKASNDDFEGEYAHGEATINRRTGQWSIEDIQLRVGINTIRISAYTENGHKAEKEIVFTYNHGNLADYEESEISYFEDGNSSTGYINDAILVILDGSVSDDVRSTILGEVCEAIDGTVIGQINGALMYQVAVTASDYDSLKQLCMDAKDVSPYVLSAVCDMVEPPPNPTVSPADENDYELASIMEATTSEGITVPDDPWKDVFQGMFGQDWDENNPSGLNWWIEAVHAPSAWNYNSYFNNIRVGVCDTGIDTGHEDLLVSRSLTRNVAQNHGTHVAGIIGATANNQAGITGMAWNKEIYNYDAYRGAKTSSEIIDGIVSLIEAGCRVVNSSNGSTIDEVDVSAHATYATAIVNNLCNQVTDKFIIVQAAGNDSIDSRRNGTFSSITSGSALDHVMIVAAADKPNNAGYKLTDFSNYGSAVTVVAPGRDIFSTIVTGGLDGSYGKMSGTSMAAPIVSGLSAMIWSLDDNQSAAQVKRTITATASTDVGSYASNDSRTYHMVNAYEAVRYALKRTTGKVTDAKTGDPIEGVTVTLNCVFGSAGTDAGDTATTSSDGLFSLRTPANATALSNIRFSKNGYVDYQMSLSNNVNSTFDVGTIILRPTVEFAGGNGDAINPYQVATAEQLDAVRDNLTAHYVQIADIDLSGIAWVPIGIGYGGGSFLPGIGSPTTVSNPFSGTYDGNNHVIKNLSIDSGEFDTVGLFGLCSDNSLIKNVVLEDITISVDKEGTDYVEQWNNGAINAVSVGGVVGRSGSQINNCSVSGNITVINCNNAYVGGITGMGRVSDSTNSAGIYVLSNRDSRYSNDGTVQCGGIVGHSGSVNGSVTKCINTGNITVVGGNYTYCGGITGEYGQVTYCVNYGNISGTSMRASGWSSFAANVNVGGITGANSSDNTSYCANLGNVYASEYTSRNGLTGGVCAGGIIGYSGYYSSGTVTNCYNAGLSIISKRFVSNASDSYEEGDGSSGRVIGGGGITSRDKNNYSLETVLTNGAVPTSGIDDTQNHGATVSQQEFDGVLSAILAQING